MQIFIYSFEGEINGIIENVTVIFDTDTNQISAQTSVGGFPSIMYNNYTPSINEGDLIYTYYGVSDRYDFLWKRRYPFAEIDETPETPQPSTLSVSVSKTDETAPNERDGTATVSVTGGVTPYQYSINNIDWQTSNLFTGLNPGNYIAYAKDVSNNIGFASFEILRAEYPPAPPVIPPVQDIICLSDGEIDGQPGFKRALVRTVFGTTPSTLFNGDFEQYDGQNWNQWTKYGGINLSRGQRKIKDGSGNLISIQNYTLIFNEPANAAKYLEHTPLPIQQGDTGKISINIGKTIGTGVTTGIYQTMIPRPATFTTSYEFRMRIKVGNYYLYNVDGGNNFEWVYQLAIITSKIDNSMGDLSSYVFSFNIPEAPVSGNMYIELFGFAKIRKIVLRPLPFLPEQTYYQQLPDYDPIEIDDIKFEKSSQNKDNDVNSITNISDNLDYYTEPLEEIEIPIGDLYIYDVGKQEFETLYAIYDQDNNPTNGWVDMGVYTQPVPFGLSLAKSLMQSYQAAHDQWTGQLKLKKGATRFSYLDTFGFLVNLVSGLPATDFNSKQFVLLGCDIDLKTNIMSNITMREYFRRIAKTSDISVPTSPNTPLPPIVNDPNNNQIIGIFTDEFNETFK